MFTSFCITNISQFWSIGLISSVVLGLDAVIFTVAYCSVSVVELLNLNPFVPTGVIACELALSISTDNW